MPANDENRLLGRVRCKCANWQIEVVVGQLGDESGCKNKGDAAAIAREVVRVERFLSESETGRFAGCSWQTTCAEERRRVGVRVQGHRAAQVREQRLPEVDVEHGERGSVPVQVQQEEEERAQHVRQLSRFAIRTELRIERPSTGRSFDRIQLLLREIEQVEAEATLIFALQECDK